MAIRILIADDHAVVRGMRDTLVDAGDIEVVGEVGDYGGLREALRSGPRPDVLLLDITMPRLSGLEVTRAVTQQFPAVRVLIFSMHHHPDYILSAVSNGAAGYVPKDTGEDELLKAIRSVAAGELYYPPPVSSVLIRHWMRPREPAESPGTSASGVVWKKLTQREAQILTCLTEGLSSRAIADRFAISPNTVANQRASILRKAGVRNTAELIRLALEGRGTAS